eukprot:scaffold36543_cov121-Isochrysis_galbana.AAC.3
MPKRLVGPCCQVERAHAPAAGKQICERCSSENGRSSFRSLGVLLHRGTDTASHVVHEMVQQDGMTPITGASQAAALPKHGEPRSWGDGGSEPSPPSGWQKRYHQLLADGAIRRHACMRKEPVQRNERRCAGSKARNPGTRRSCNHGAVPLCARRAQSLNPVT